MITYCERFDAATKSYKDRGNASMTDQDVAMDFWDGLDPGRYSQFKTDIKNGMTAGSIKAEEALKDVNKVCTLAANWIKTQPVHRQGNASTYVTSYLNRVEEKLMDEETSEVFNSQEQPWSSVQTPEKIATRSLGTMSCASSVSKEVIMQTDAPIKRDRIPLLFRTSLPLLWRYTPYSQC